MKPIIEKQSWIKRLKTWSNSWVGVIILVAFFMMFIAQNFIIPSGSMIKTLLIGDMLFVKKFAYGMSTPHIPFFEIPLVPNTDLVNDPASGHIVNGDTPQRADIVVFRYPANPQVHYIKRCVGIPGDELFVQNKLLYLHPAEGNAYIKKHYPASNIINKEGKLWVKSPYMINHKGIWNDSSVSLYSQTIPANTVVYRNGDKQDLLYIQKNDLLVHFSDEALAKQHYPGHDTFNQFGKLWIVNPKGYPLTVKEVRERVQSMNFDDTFNFIPYDYVTNSELFDFYSSKTPFKVAKDHYFMMGDNRDHSNDSRAWGSVHYGLIEGTPWFVYFSIAEDFSIRWDRVGKTITDLEEQFK